MSNYSSCSKLGQFDSLVDLVCRVALIQPLWFEIWFAVWYRICRFILLSNPTVKSAIRPSLVLAMAVICQFKTTSKRSILGSQHQTSISNWLHHTQLKIVLSFRCQEQFYDGISGPFSLIIRTRVNGHWDWM